MNVDTELFGNLELTEEQVLIFRQGLPGFEQYTRFTLVDIEDAPFTYLQSVEDSGLTFLLTDPFLFFPDYEFDLPESASDLLQVNAMEQLSVRVIVSIRNGLETATINLVAPIVINTEKRVGKQVVLTKTIYSTKHPLLNSNERDGDDNVSSI